ncbi:MAG TPA: hypothetical protein VF958_02785, partial [Thermoanaerobaculia bacterium]
PIIFVISAGDLRPLVFDEMQRHEILLTILQSFLGFLLLLNLELRFHEALVLFVFWLTQFLFPATRHVMIYVYLAWCLIEMGRMLIWERHVPPAWAGLRKTLARRFA